MNYLLDTNICSAFMLGKPGLFHRFIQHSGRLWISVVCLSELYTWAYKQKSPDRILNNIQELLKDVQTIPFDDECAHQLGKTRGALLQVGISINSTDLMIASVALTHDLILVTNNTKDFQNIPDLTLEDWLN